MSTRFPALFLSHGAPSLIIEDCPTRTFLLQLGKEMGRPKGIVSVSAHWSTPEPRVTMHPQPPTIHDFGGFPDELYTLKYPAPGDPLLAQRLLSLLHAQGIAADGDISRGYDHGAWAPLILMYPEATIPVIQLSVQPRRTAADHLALGKALQPLREEGILILASGSTTHNIRDFFGRELNAAPLPYAEAFARWVTDAVVNGRTDELLEYGSRAPYAVQNHPTPEHFLPLFVPLGSGGSGRQIHDAFTYGALSMAAFIWE
jgi:4,5-DOPA dioxygenase extradiol